MEAAALSLSGIELFEDLTDAERDRLSRLCRSRRYCAGQMIVGHEEPSNDVYFILAGHVRATVFSPSGRQVSFADLAAGMSFGELAAIDGAPRSATIVALSDTVVACMSAAAFARVLDDHPAVTSRLLRHLVALVRRLSDRVVEFSVLPVRLRVRAEMVRLAHQHGVCGNRSVIRPVPTQADIASRLSTHREAVSRELNALVRAGLIARGEGGLTITDVARLGRLVETGLHRRSCRD